MWPFKPHFQQVKSVNPGRVASDEDGLFHLVSGTLEVAFNKFLKEAEVNSSI